MDRKSKGVINKEIKEEMKRTDEQTVRIIMKWITAILFMKFFWIFEKFIVIIPAAPIKLWLGLWIMLPNYHGEFFMYNLLSDKLDKFEREMRKMRNTIVAKFMFFMTTTLHKQFLKLKPYIHTDNLRIMRENIKQIDNDFEKELELRKKISQQTKEFDSLIRDSTVLNSDTLRMMNTIKSQSTINNSVSSAYSKGGRVQPRFDSRISSQKDEDLQSMKTQTSMYKRHGANTKQSSVEKNRDSYLPQNTSRPMKLVKKKIQNDLDSSLYSQYLQEEDVFLDDYDKKMQTLTMMPNVEQSFEILQQSSTKKSTRPVLMSRNKQLNQSISVLDQTMDSTPSGATSRKKIN
ncbi:UNKNOWN [Stylonychia lemnae]|uniref:Uncharacterized protein n=1 Tax=Stylonychia lemnae TaxID=5949 RepID=A0A078A2A0_STYLE|nr:UNKNOWN [Stylonychia lemnae]|eukprot:CDW75947.1 UNKNOWN [Stylonychia lemnae]